MLVKNLKSNHAVVGYCTEDLALAEAWMDIEMTMWKEERSYQIVENVNELIKLLIGKKIDQLVYLHAIHVQDKGAGEINMEAEKRRLYAEWQAGLITLDEIVADIAEYRALNAAMVEAVLANEKQNRGYYE